MAGSGSKRLSVCLAGDQATKMILQCLPFELYVKLLCFTLSVQVHVSLKFCAEL